MIRRPWVLTAWATMAALACRAALVVDWGGNYVSANQSFANSDANAHRAGGFVGGNPLQLSPTSGYSYALPSARFHGMTTNTYVNPFVGGKVVNSPSDRLEFKGPDSGDTSAYLVLWKQADFLAGFNKGYVGFGAGDTVFVDIVTWTAFRKGRVVVRKGGAYFVSAAVLDSTTETVTPTLLSWYAYNPAVDAFAIGAAATPVGNGRLTGLTEVGILFDTVNTGSDATRIENVEIALSVRMQGPGTVLLLR